MASEETAPPNPRPACIGASGTSPSPHLDQQIQAVVPAGWDCNVHRWNCRGVRRTGDVARGQLRRLGADLAPSPRPDGLCPRQLEAVPAERASDTLGWRGECQPRRMRCGAMAARQPVIPALPCDRGWNRSGHRRGPPGPGVAHSLPMQARASGVSLFNSTSTPSLRGALFIAP